MSDTIKPTKLPRISEANYEAVRRVLKQGVPASYPEWLDLNAKWVNEYPSVVFVEVDPKKLSQFFGSAGTATTSQLFSTSSTKTPRPQHHSGWTDAPSRIPLRTTSASERRVGKGA